MRTNASSYTNTLAYTLFDKTSGATVKDQVAAIYKEKTSFLTQNANGKYSLPTVDLLDEANTPAAKLQAASRVASATKVFTDAATRTGIADRLPSLTEQVEKVISTLGEAVSSLKQQGSLKGSLGTVSSTLSTLQTVIGQMKTLAGKLSSKEESSLKGALSLMDTKTKSIAEVAGVSYTSPITGESTTTTTKSAAASLSRPQLIDYLV